MFSLLERLLMASKNPLDGKSILIVDDEPDILEVLEELLSMCSVTKAATYNEAKDLLEHRYFDIAILDIMGVEGYKLLDIARERNVTGVMLTAHAMTPDNIERSFKNGAASFVPKDEITNITTFLNDILEAKEKGKSLWWRWFDRLADYFDRKFGPDWQEKHHISVR